MSFIRLLILVLLIFTYSNGYGQSLQLEFIVKDKNTLEPIENVHIFLANTTYGTVSDHEGRVSLSIPEELKEDMIISHLSYEVLVISNFQYQKLLDGTSQLLNPNSLQLNEIEISSRISKKRKKQIKRFLKAFFGDNKEGDQCKLLNSEVLIFQEDNQELKVTATDLLKIENPFLGYKLNYFLKYLKIDKNGSIEFLGQSHFIDWVIESNQEEIEQNRLKTYQNSPKYFFKSFIDGDYAQLGFDVSQVYYDEGRFHLEKVIKRDSIFKASKNGSKFTIQFDNYLQVINKNKQDISYAAVGVRPGGLESQRFGSTGRTESAFVNFQTSHFYKLSPYIILNKHGNILNTKDIREYGYWAEQKMAHELPFNYGNDYQMDLLSEKEDAQDEPQNNLSSKDKLVLLISLLHNEDRRIKEQTIQMLSENWENGFTPCLIEILRFSREDWLNNSIHRLLSEKNGVNGINNFYNWLEWIWSQEIPNEDYFFNLKGEIYKHIDSKFEYYFKDRNTQNEIKLEEVVWGGVKQDGIPPLRDPEMISAERADYLEDGNIIFGFYINGIPRAYPKRILAWHEFFVDDFDDKRIAGVYCTLCGTVIAYDMTHKGTYHDLGTSGFLFRSNKLMYDKATQSLWSTIEGKPVLGPLIGKGIELETYPVVTTTWKEWKTRHPDTEVLSLNTGHQRDYDEGAAYKDYFATDELMFPVPYQNASLKNKDEVFIVRTEGYKVHPLAISVNYMKKKKWHQDKIGPNSIIITSDKSGAVRAYNASEIVFKSSSKGKLKDSRGRIWTIEEECLTSDDGQRLDRVSGHNIFWFAWQAAYPNGRLIK